MLFKWVTSHHFVFFSLRLQFMCMTAFSPFLWSQLLGIEVNYLDLIIRWFSRFEGNNLLICSRLVLSQSWSQRPFQSWVSKFPERWGSPGCHSPPFSKKPRLLAWLYKFLFLLASSLNKSPLPVARPLLFILCSPGAGGVLWLSSLSAGTKDPQPDLDLGSPSVSQTQLLPLHPLWDLLPCALMGGTWPCTWHLDQRLELISAPISALAAQILLHLGHCGRMNDDPLNVPSQSPRLRVCYLVWQKGLCRCE